MPARKPQHSQTDEAATPQEIQKAIDRVLAKFLPYQRKYIADTNRFVLYEKAVRTGITYCHSFKMSWKLVMRHPDAKKHNELFASKNKVTASEYTNYHRKWAEFWNTLFGPKFIDLERWTSEKCVYPGGDVLILSSDPNAFRGMEGSVTLDEFAFHDQQPALYAAAQSRSQWLEDGQVALISSHSHPETTFARLANEARTGGGHFSPHRTTLVDAVEQGLALKVPGAHRDLLKRAIEKGYKDSVKACNAAFIEQIRRSCLSEEDFQREYMCEPAKLSQLVGANEYERCVKEDHTPDFLPDSNYGELFVGIDIGYTRDLTVAWVLQRGYDKQGQACYRTVAVKATNGPFPMQFQSLSPLFSHSDVAGGYVDQGAVGRPLADAIEQAVGGAFERLQMTQNNKAGMAETLRAFVQSRRITLPNDPKVKQSLLCVRRTPMPGGGVRYEGNTTFDHGDYFWAAALALWAAEGESKAQLLLPEAQPAVEVMA